MKIKYPLVQKLWISDNSHKNHFADIISFHWLLDWITTASAKSIIAIITHLSKDKDEMNTRTETIKTKNKIDNKTNKTDNKPNKNIR